MYVVIMRCNVLFVRAGKLYAAVFGRNKDDDDSPEDPLLSLYFGNGKSFVAARSLAVESTQSGTVSRIVVSVSVRFNNILSKNVTRFYEINGGGGEKK